MYVVWLIGKLSVTEPRGMSSENSYLMGQVLSHVTRFFSTKTTAIKDKRLNFNNYAI